MMNINMFGTHFCVAAALGLLAGTVSAVESARPFADGKGPSTCDGRRLVWSDEFDGTALDPAKWGYELGFIRNREYQFYTNLEENVRVEGGKLVLQARRVDWPNPGYDAAAPTNDWKRTRPKLTITSGSVNTRGKFAFAGRRCRRTLGHGPRSGRSGRTSARLAGRSVARSTCSSTTERRPTG